jgi:hypothetical protein
VDKSGCGFLYRGVCAGVGMKGYVTYMLHTGQKFDSAIVVWLVVFSADNAVSLEPYHPCEWINQVEGFGIEGCARVLVRMAM